jgi:PPOX class probable F420-dependent enzyme
MSFQSSDLTASQLEFMRENHLATLTTLRPDGSPHVVPVGFTFDIDNNIVRVITFAKSMKARHAAQGGRAVVSQVDRGRWITLEGTVRLRTEADIVAKAVEAYAGRYRQPKIREDRVVIEITVDKVMGRA